MVNGNVSQSRLDTTMAFVASDLLGGTFRFFRSKAEPQAFLKFSNKG